MHAWHYIFLSFIQAATEFLPISSSGHLLFLKQILHVSEIPIVFDIVVHSGSLVAILLFYREKITSTFLNAWKEIHDGKKDRSSLRMLFYIVLSTAVTFVFYIIFRKPIELKYQSPAVLFPAYLITSSILFSTYFAKKKGEIPIAKRGIALPVIVGLFQGIAIMPGISRSGATIVPLLHMNVKKEEAAYYSFFLAIPAILGALVFKLTEMQNEQFLFMHWKLITLSFVVSAVFSYLFLAFLVYVIQRSKLWMFSVYTLIFAIVSWIVFY